MAEQLGIQQRNSADILYNISQRQSESRRRCRIVAIHNSIPSQLCHTNNSIEMISVLLNTRPKLLLICLYIPPNCTSEYHQETLDAISNIQDVRTIILGDFNTPDIDWLTLCGGSPFSHSLCNTLHHLNYRQLVNILQLIKQAIYLTLYLHMLLIELSKYRFYAKFRSLFDYC